MKSLLGYQLYKMFKAFLPCGDGKVVIGHDALFGKYRICGAPGLGGVVGGALILELAVILQSDKAVGKACRYPKHEMVALGKL